MDQNKSNVDEFFEKLPVEDKQDANIFDEVKSEIKPQVKPEIKDDTDPEKVHDSIKDRRHRRLEQRLQAEREANIVLNERIKSLSEMDRFAKEHANEINQDVAKMFDSSDIGKENALRLSRVIAETQQRAKEEAVKEIEEKRSQEIEEQKQYEIYIDNQLESLEDEFNVDLTSDSPKARKTRREFLELVQQLSPKDEQGNITGYVDFDSTFEVYQKTTVNEKQDNTRKKEIASRSMQRSNSSTETIQKRTPGFSGWRTDYERGII